MYKSVIKAKSLPFFYLPGFLYVCCLSLTSLTIQAAPVAGADESVQFGSTKIIQYKIDSNFKVRGWKLSSQVYIGNTKINGEWGFGLLVDKDTYAYGLNNTQASFMWRF
jgi:hypothetical protein